MTIDGRRAGKWNSDDPMQVWEEFFLKNHSSSDIKIFDDVSGRFADVLQVALIGYCGNTHIPEIYEIFGATYTLPFLDIFSNTTVKVPSRRVLEDAIRDTCVYIQLEQTPEGHKTQVVRDLAVKYGITGQRVRSIYYETQQRLRRFKLPRLSKVPERSDVRLIKK
jgi:hypothetical protein